VLLIVAADVDAPDVEAIDVVSGEAERRWDERDGDEDRDQNGERCSEAHRAEERHADDAEAGEGDDHGESGEHDGASGGGVGPGG
jgi:hypothetical protein